MASSTGFSTSLSSGNITATQGDELYFGLGWSGHDGDAWTAGSGYTLRQSETKNATAERIATEDAIITKARFSVPTSENWLAMIATFKPATTTSGGGGPTKRLDHDPLPSMQNHLGSTVVVTDASSSIVETLDYYPYGAARFDTKVGAYQGAKRKYIGQVYDDINGLNYLNARYLNNTRGQFISEDPIFWSGNQNLLDPQSLNSYSYANDNPITKSDPSGRFIPEAAIGAIVGTVVGVGAQATQDYLNGRASGLDKYAAAGGFVAGGINVVDLNSSPNTKVFLFKRSRQEWLSATLLGGR